MNRRDVLQAMFAAPFGQQTEVPRSRAALPLVGDQAADKALVRVVADESQLLEAVAAAVAGEVSEILVVDRVQVGNEIPLTGIKQSLNIRGSGLGAIFRASDDPGDLFVIGDGDNTPDSLAENIVQATIEDLTLKTDGVCVRLDSSGFVDQLQPTVSLRGLRCGQWTSGYKQVSGKRGIVRIRDCVGSVDIETWVAFCHGCRGSTFEWTALTGALTGPMVNVQGNYFTTSITCGGGAATCVVQGNNGDAIGNCDTSGVTGPKANANNVGYTVVL